MRKPARVRRPVLELERTIVAVGEHTNRKTAEEQEECKRAAGERKTAVERMPVAAGRSWVEERKPAAAGRLAELRKRELKELRSLPLVPLVPWL